MCNQSKIGARSVLIPIPHGASPSVAQFTTSNGDFRIPVTLVPMEHVDAHTQLCTMEAQRYPQSMHGHIVYTYCNTL